MIHVMMLLIGCALAGWNAWHFLGRSPRARAWARSLQDEQPRQILVAWPLLSLALLCGAVLGVTDDATAASRVASLLLLASVVLALAYFMAPLPVPGWLRPQWYVDTRTQRGTRD